MESASNPEQNSSAWMQRKKSPLECMVCKQLFTSLRKSSLPRVGSCGHSVCGNCAPNLSGCPRCLQHYTTVKNYSLIEAIDHLRDAERKIHVLEERLRREGIQVEELYTDEELKEEEDGAEEQEPTRQGEGLYVPFVNEYILTIMTFLNADSINKFELMLNGISQLYMEHSKGIDVFAYYHHLFEFLKDNDDYREEWRARLSNEAPKIRIENYNQIVRDGADFKTIVSELQKCLFDDEIIRHSLIDSLTARRYLAQDPVDEEAQRLQRRLQSTASAICTRVLNYIYPELVENPSILLGDGSQVAQANPGVQAQEESHQTFEQHQEEHSEIQLRLNEEDEPMQMDQQPGPSHQVQDEQVQSPPPTNPTGLTFIETLKEIIGRLSPEELDRMDEVLQIYLCLSHPPAPPGQPTTIHYIPVRDAPHSPYDDDVQYP